MKGYYVTGSQQYDHPVDGQGGQEVIKSWRTTIQTPFAVDMDFSSFEKGFLHDRDEMLLGLGIAVILDPPDTRKLYRFTRMTEGRPDGEANGVFNMNFNQNFRTGFWETVIYHTLPVSVPGEFRKEETHNERRNNRN